jgi:hypothetical protein
LSPDCSGQPPQPGGPGIGNAPIIVMSYDKNIAQSLMTGRVSSLAPDA